jgi:hypothetical protein
MFDHVDLKKARGRVSPISKRADRNTAPDRGADARSTLALSINAFARTAQGTVDRRGAYAQQLVLDRGIKAKL